MSYDIWLSFAAMIVIATAAPGPNILVIILTQIQSGYHGVLWAIGGNLSANALITLFAVLGSHSLIEAGGPLLLFIYAMIGGLFLCFLGFQTLSGAIESGRRLTEKTKALSANRENGTNAARAFLTTFTNPKVILFQSVILPQFLDFGAPVAPQYFVMMGTICTSVLVIHSAYALFAGKVLSAFGSSKNKTALLLIYFSGATFLAIGILLLAHTIWNAREAFSVGLALSF